MKILLADDDVGVRGSLELALDNMGHEVAAVGDGRAAWSVFQTQPVDVVLTDWMMPELDGLELCRRIRAERRSRYTYVIILTALEGQDRWLEGMAAGADDFVTKPCRVAELQARLRVAERTLGLQENVRQLEGLLPICAYCKKIEDEQGNWTP